MTSNIRYLWCTFMFFVGAAIGSSFATNPMSNLVFCTLVIMPVYLGILYLIDKKLLSKDRSG